MYCWQTSPGAAASWSRRRLTATVTIMEGVIAGQLVISAALLLWLSFYRFGGKMFLEYCRGWIRKNWTSYIRNTCSLWIYNKEWGSWCLHTLVVCIYVCVASGCQLLASFQCSDYGAAGSAITPSYEWWIWWYVIITIILLMAWWCQSHCPRLWILHCILRAMQDKYP